MIDIWRIHLAPRTHGGKLGLLLSVRGTEGLNRVLSYICQSRWTLVCGLELRVLSPSHHSLSTSICVSQLFQVPREWVSLLTNYNLSMKHQYMLYIQVTKQSHEQLLPYLFFASNWCDCIRYRWSASDSQEHHLVMFLDCMMTRGILRIATVQFPTR